MYLKLEHVAYLFILKLDGPAHQVDEDLQFVTRLNSGVQSSGILTPNSIATKNLIFQFDLKNWGLIHDAH